VTGEISLNTSFEGTLLRDHRNNMPEKILGPSISGHEVRPKIKGAGSKFINKTSCKSTERSIKKVSANKSDAKIQKEYID